MQRICYLAFVFVFALNQINGEVPEKIYLTVYYESQCPDSRQFIKEQLHPAIDLLHNYLKLRLVPFGKASSINKGYNGFQCQHGPTECLGNMVQSCALDLMQERNDLEKVSYVACEMETQAGTRQDMQCVIKADLPAEKVEDCIASNKGISLQLEEEYYTKLLEPTFIPTITLNGDFNQQIQDSALQDLIGTLCFILKHTTACAQHYNTLAMTYVLF